ncbi:hypothetical protein [Streptomyces sp. NBC_00687]|uniref:hypothetical protein n=1 Tax=Streptomyces sp. NBC_00687 TaxID=2975807 RepID=UPI00225BBFAB|nr:hypothetical protein [Streptomyces sp. NBC_00687]MCX4914359.1 hypothetical protein [Streptomyces sp. NBC_00687]
MTQPTDKTRVPEGTERAAGYDLKTEPDGSTTLILRTVGTPLELIEHRMYLDPHLTRSLLRALARDLRDVPSPGPRPEMAALIDAVRADDRTAIAAAGSAINDRILSLWTNGGAAA